MLSVGITRNSGQPLADQIVAGIKRQIDDRHLLPNGKLPSIRNFAETHNVSRFTVVEAYDRLVAMGYLQSRRGAGFYIAAPLAHDKGDARVVSNSLRSRRVLSVRLQS
jgi:DNA-binding GntR family transcriptional regulator